MLKKACLLILSLVTVLIFGVRGFFQYAHAWVSETTPGVSLSSPGQEAPEEIKEVSANKAAQVKIITSRLEKELAGQKAPDGTVYLLLTTEWENIHPKEKIEKSRLEKKPDRTMGAGGLLQGKEKKKEELVEADVAYKVPNFFDHAYCLADGQSHALDKLTERVEGGIGLQSEFGLQKFGDKKRVNLVYLVPSSAKNLAFQFFDYSNGHILISVTGEVKLARGAGGAAGKVLDQIKDRHIELAALKLDFRPEFQGEEAPAGWRYAVVELGGKSLSPGNIVQIDPSEYVWLQTQEGSLCYSTSATTTEEGLIRFTPEVMQSQQIAFLVPSGEKNFALGVRIQNSVYSLRLGGGFSLQMPVPLAAHRDGKTMEIMVFGARKEESRVILDLGIKSLVKSGLEIQTSDQFILKAGDEDISYDETATASLQRRPPEPFIIPPQTFVRFELAYEIENRPTSLYYRGYESEKYFELGKID